MSGVGILLPAGFISLAEAVRRCATRLAPEVMEKAIEADFWLEMLPTAILEAILPVLTTPNRIVPVADAPSGSIPIDGGPGLDELLSNFCDDGPSKAAFVNQVQDYRVTNGARSIAMHNAARRLRGWLADGAVAAICQRFDTGIHVAIPPEDWRTSKGQQAFTDERWPNDKGKYSGPGTGIPLLQAEALDRFLHSPKAMEAVSSPAHEVTIATSARRGRPIAPADLEKWYRGYVGIHEKAGTKPTWPQIMRAIEQRFPRDEFLRPQRILLRDLRKKLTPAHWSTRGVIPASKRAT